MSVIAKVCYLSLIGTAMVLAVPAQSETTMAGSHEAKAPVTNRLAANKLSANLIAANRLASNGIAKNRVVANGLTSNSTPGSFSAQTGVPSDGAFTDVAAIELPNGMRLTR